MHSPRCLPHLALAFTLSWSGHADAQTEQVRIYKADGTLQCGMGQEISLNEMKKELEQLGATVISAEKRVVPFEIITVCGAPTGAVNTYVISSADWEEIQTGFVGPSAFARWVFDFPTVHVYKYDGTLQCGMGKEVTLEQMEAELRAAGVEVISKRKDFDGLMHSTVCGGSTGSVNVFEVPAEQFEAAQAAGFAFFARIRAPASASPAGAPDSLNTMEASTGDDVWPWPW